MNNVCRAIDLVITYLEDYSRESDQHIKDLAWGSAMGLLQGLKIMTEEKQNERTRPSQRNH